LFESLCEEFPCAQLWCSLFLWWKESCQVWVNASLLLRLESISLPGAYSHPTHSNIGNNAPSASHDTLER
jgi:hypothetical protein